VLRGDVDNFGIRFRRAQSIEEHVSLSVIIKQFFAGELEVVCSMPEFWRRVTILYSGSDDFAVYGAWDSLILLAREVQRLFHRLSEETMRELPGPEGKTISMALAVAPETDAGLAAVYRDAGRKLEIAKASGKDCFYLLGRTLEWKQIAEAQELKERMARMVTEFGCSTQFLSELASFYRDTTVLPGAGRSRWQEKRFERPWRFYRRLNRLLAGSRDREFQRVRTNLIGELIGKGSSQRKLRPAGRVALEWARLTTEE
jgi:CRISPR-associated protein Csm1